MIDAIIILIICYLVFRFLTTYLIPRLTKRSIRRFEDKYRQSHPEIFNKDKKETKE